MKCLVNFALTTLGLLSFLQTAPQSSCAQDWMQFRGPRADGVAETASFPDTWSESENVLWKHPTTGRSWASPIVVGDQVFLVDVTRREGENEEAKPGLYFGGNREQTEDVVLDWQLTCLGLNDGTVLWQKVLHTGKPTTPRHIKNSYASETPVSDGENLYVLFGDVGLYCVGLDGEIKWQKELEPFKTRYDWGPAASPVLHEGKLIYVNDNEENSYLACLDAKTGEEIWRTAREEKSNWSTPFVWQNALRTEIVVPATGMSRSYDLNGKQLYQWSGSSSITIATPYEANGLLIYSSGYVGDKSRPIMALKPGAAGDISLKEGESSNEFIVWSDATAAPYNPSTLVVGEQLYVLYDRGTFASYNAKTGEEIFGQQRIRDGKSFTASPWSANGKIYCLNEFGETFVFQAGPEFKLLHSNKLESEQVAMATPAIAGDLLLLRTGDALYCIGNQK